MSRKPPQFEVGDTVCPRLHPGTTLPETGTVVERYDFADQYRYVVKFGDGREEVFFEKGTVFDTPDGMRRGTHVHHPLE